MSKIYSLSRKILHRYSFLVILLLLIILFLLNPIEFKEFFINKKIVDYQCPDCNVIIISIDALRADHLGVYGYSRNTSPFIDSFAKEGVLFENAFAPRGVTWVSLTSMLTSLYPKSTNVRIQGEVLDSDVATLSSILNEKGYKTSAFLAKFCKAGDYHFDTKYCAQYNDEQITEQAIEWLKKNKNNKFFLWIHYKGAHYPYASPSPDEYDIFTDRNYTGIYDRPLERGNPFIKNKINLSYPDYNQIVSLYDGGVYYSDALVNQIYEVLNQLGLIDNSIIIITSDHGDDLYQHNNYIFHGCSIYDSTLHIPLIIQLPGHNMAGIRVTDIVENIDITPTVLDLVNIPKLSSFEGASLLPLFISNSSKNGFYSAFSELYNDPVSLINRSKGGLESVFSIRTKEWRYIYNPKNFTPDSCWAESGDYIIDNEELYNILIDPNETTNVVDQFPDIASSLKEELLKKYVFDTHKSYPVTKADEETIEQLRALGYIN